MEVPEIIISSEKKKPLKLGNKEYISAYYFSLTEKEIEKAAKELLETEEKKIRKLKELRDKLANDEGVIYRTDTAYLLRYLRFRKYDTAKAYQNIREGYIFKKNHPEAFRVSADLKQLLNRNIIMMLPYTDEEGNVLFYVDIGKWKMEEVSFEEIIQITAVIADVMTMNPKMQVNGIIAIWNMKELTAQHITSSLSSWGLRGLTFAAQNLYPWRVKKLLALNAGRLSRLLLAMLRPLLRNKILDRITLIGSDIKELHEHVNPVLLPKELGGYLEENQCSTTQSITDNIPYLNYENSFILN